MRTQGISPLPRATPLRKLARLLLLLALPLWVAASQDKPDATAAPDLRTLRVDYRKGLLEALLPQKKAYRDELALNERKLAAEADFNGAIKARNERAQLEQEIMAMEQELPALTAQARSLHAASLPDRIVLSPAEAQLTGVTVDPKDKTLTGWKSAHSLATWRVPALPAGGYEIFLTYSCPAKGSATFIVHEARYTLEFKVADAAPKPVEKLLGTLRVQDNNTTISLSAENIEAAQPIHIHSVTLVPANR